MLTKETVIDQIEITELGAIHVRRATYFLEDGIRVSGPQYHRSAYEPGDAAIAKDDPKVQAHAALAWTPEVIAAYRARIAAEQILEP